MGAHAHIYIQTQVVKMYFIKKNMYMLTTGGEKQTFGMNPTEFVRRFDAGTTNGQGNVVVTIFIHWGFRVGKGLILAI